MKFRPRYGLTRSESDSPPVRHALGAHAEQFRFLVALGLDCMRTNADEGDLVGARGFRWRDWIDEQRRAERSRR